MKKILILVLCMMALLVCFFAISVSAAPQNFQSYEVELVNGSRITVYETQCWDQWQGHIHLTNTTYTEAPVDTEGEYAVLDWSQVKVVDFTNAWGHRYNESTGEYDLKVGTNDGYSLHISSKNFTASNATSLEKLITGKATMVSGAAFVSLPALKEIVIDNNLNNIQYNGFSSNKALTTVTIKEGTQLKVIGQQVFKDCSALVNITLPETLTSMGEYVFSGCSSLATINWLRQITSIPNGTFDGCTVLQLEIPSYVISIGSNAFQNCDSLVSVKIPDGVTNLGSFAFAYCDNLEELIISDNSQISNRIVGILRSCPKITSVRIPPLVTDIGYDSFWDCKSLTEIVWPNNLTKISAGNNFSGCTALKAITIPNSVTQLASNNFSGCTALEEVRLGTGITHISDGLLNLKSLKRVYINSSVLTIGQYVWGYSNVADSSTNITFIFTGSLEQAQALQEYLRTNGNAGHAPNNSKFYDAALVSAGEYDVTQEPSGYHLVYGYNICKAFYGGHTWAGETIIENVDYLRTIEIKDSCSVCKEKEAKSTIAPLFIDRGYSVRAFGGSPAISHGYTVNFEAIEEYKAYKPDFEFGIIAAVNENASDAFAPQLGDENVVSGTFKTQKHIYVDVMVSGIPEDKMDIYVVFCLYVADGEDLFYLDQATSTTIKGVQYSTYAK